MIVDAHAHLVPPDLLTAIRKDAAKFPNVRQIEDGGSLAVAFAGGKATRPVSKPSALRRCWSSATSSPRSMGERR